VRNSAASFSRKARRTGARGAVRALACALIWPAFAGSAQAAADSSSDRARAYYLFSLSQQAQFKNEMPDAIRYLNEAIQSSDSTDLRLELAALYSNMNRVDDAEMEAREAVKKDPASAAARRTLAQILFRRAASGQDVEPRMKESEALYQELVDKDQADEDSAIALADLQRGRGDPAAAAATLEAYREKHSFSPALDVRLSRLYLEMGRSEEARKLLESAIDKAGDDREARELLAEILDDAGKPAEAVEIYRPLVEASPDNAYAQYRLGTLLNAAGKFTEAKEHLLIALDSDPANVRVLLGLGQSLLGDGEARQAEEVYGRALNQDPGSLEARFFLGRIAQARAEDDRALALYGQILTQTGERASSQEKAFYGLASYQVGVIRYLQGNYLEAAKDVRQAIDSAARPSEELYTLLARIALDSGNLEEAGRVLEEGAAKLPGNVEIKAFEAEVLLRQKERAAARQIFKEILQDGQESVDSYLLIVQACVRAEQPKEGEAWMRKASEKHPDSREISFQSAALIEQTGRFKEAEAAFRKHLERYPDHAEALNYLGYMLADRGEKLEESLSLIERAVALQPENAAFLDSLGWVMFKMGHPREAEAQLVRAVEGSRNDATVLEHLGDVLVALGRPSEAMDKYRKAMDRDPEKPEQLQKKMRKLGAKLGSP
jgi:tetratricopeptide (TPR) repeat protein